MQLKTDCRAFILLFICISIIFIYMMPVSEAHILIIAATNSTSHDLLVHNTANVLKSKGYNVLELYGENATSENIVKGMYNADAVIYSGHGGYISGDYDMNGGPATPPFALVGYDGQCVWGVGDKMREGFSGKLFQAPFKKNIPVILVGACFSAGWVETKEVANPTETIYNFSEMFTGAGANYYATVYAKSVNNIQIVDIVAQFLNGAGNFSTANQINLGLTLTDSAVYDGQTIWTNNQTPSCAFVGNWSGTFPKPDQTKPYNATAAEAWYEGSLPAPTDELVYEAPVSKDKSEDLLHQMFNSLFRLLNLFN